MNYLKLKCLFLSAVLMLGKYDQVVKASNLCHADDAPVCEDNGECKVKDGSAYCECNEGWGGNRCHQEDKCIGYDCFHGGMCEVNGEGNAECNCKGKWSGKRCHIHSSCKDYSCDGGWCEVDDAGNAGCNYYPSMTPSIEASMAPSFVDKCSNLECYNNGTCAVKNGKAECDCVGGYSGKHCHVKPACNVDPVPPDCINYPSGAPTVFVLCDNYDCYNGGICKVNDDGDAECDCQGGFSGKRCHAHPSCENVSCDGGWCEVDDAGTPGCNYYPTMAPSLEASIAPSFIDLCSKHTCNNGGTCSEVDGKATCECDPSYYGKHCNNLKDCVRECNNGDCAFDQDGEMYCICNEGWGSELCDKEESSSTSNLSNSSIFLIVAFVTCGAGILVCFVRSIRMKLQRHKQIPEDLRFSNETISVEIGDREVV